MLAVLNRGFKWLGKVFGYQESKVSIICLIFLGFIGVTVNNSKAVFVVFCGNLSRWIGTEGPYFVIEGGSVINKLGLIKVLV